MSTLRITDKTLSRIVDRIAEAVRARPETTKSSLLNVVAAEIVGPGHDWGFLKGADRASRDLPPEPAPPRLDPAPEGPVLVGTRFSICDLPGDAFGWDREAAEDFLFSIEKEMTSAMSEAGNRVIDANLPACESWEGFDHPSFREPEFNVLRVSDGAWLENQTWAARGNDGWVTDRAKATAYRTDVVLMMDLPADCALVRVPVPEFGGYEPEADGAEPE